MTTPTPTTDLVASPRSALVASCLSVDAIVGQADFIQEAVSRAMKSGEHYGVIPGTTGKPCLLKPGAEKLSMLFRLRPTYQITRRDLDGGHREYEIVCTLTGPSGTAEGQGVGLCSTMESRYRWRKGTRSCPLCGVAAIIKGKVEYGGGWLCWGKSGGCGHKWPDGAQEIESQSVERVENEDLADVWNTVLKMGKKRSMVDAILTATAASDMFTQDLEDRLSEPPDEPAPPARPAPPPTPPQAAQGTQQAPSAPPRPAGLMTSEQIQRYHIALDALADRYGHEAFKWAADKAGLGNLRTVTLRAAASAVIKALRVKLESMPQTTDVSEPPNEKPLTEEEEEKYLQAAAAAAAADDEDEFTSFDLAYPPSPDHR